MFKALNLYVIIVLAALNLYASAFRPTLTNFIYSTHTALHASTAKTTNFLDCKIIKNEIEAQDLRSIDIEVSEDITQQYQQPGQYCQIKVGDSKPGFYAIRSPPDGRKVLSFIVKESESNAPLTSCQLENTIQMSCPQGNGFKIAENFDGYKYDFPTTQVLMLACGSGLAPIASAIDSSILGMRTTSYNSLFERRGLLYLGARTENHLPCKSDFARWEQAGIKIVPVLSQPSPGWKGRTGYVQDALKSDGVPVPRNIGVLLCGQRGMVENVKSLLLDAGVFEGRILLNF